MFFARPESLWLGPGKITVLPPQNSWKTPGILLSPVGDHHAKPLIRQTCNSLQCRRILDARVDIFVLGRHLGFGNRGGLRRGNISLGSRPAPRLYTNPLPVKHPRWRQRKPDLLFSVPLQNNACTARLYRPWSENVLLSSVRESTRKIIIYSSLIGNLVRMERASPLKRWRTGLQLEEAEFQIKASEIKNGLNTGRLRRQRGSVVRAGDLNAEDPGSNPLFGLMNGFVLGDPRDNFTTLCK